MPEPQPPSLTIKPARPGLIVRDPISREPLPAEGRTVPRSTYWLRRRRDGDVVECEPVEASAPAASAPEEDPEPSRAPRRGRRPAAREES